MALPQGINFRQTVAFVTDGANEFFNSTDELATFNTPTYPITTPQGNTVGWETGTTIGTRDRNSGIDQRLAGVNFANADTNYRIDLPSAGDYSVRLASGDANYSQNPTITLFDGSTSLAVLANGSTGAGGNFRDATNTIYSSAAWPGSNTALTKTFATTICRFLAGGTNKALAHVYVESAGGGGFTLMGQGCM